MIFVTKTISHTMNDKWFKSNDANAAFEVQYLNSDIMLVEMDIGFMDIGNGTNDQTIIWLTKHPEGGETFKTIILQPWHCVLVVTINNEQELMSPEEKESSDGRKLRRCYIARRCTYTAKKTDESKNDDKPLKRFQILAKMNNELSFSGQFNSTT